MWQYDIDWFRALWHGNSTHTAWQRFWVIYISAVILTTMFGLMRGDGSMSVVLALFCAPLGIMVCTNINNAVQLLAKHNYHQNRTLVEWLVTSTEFARKYILWPVLMVRIVVFFLFDTTLLYPMTSSPNAGIALITGYSLFGALLSCMRVISIPASAP